ncbi:MAG TPA: putative baseplate assembly protein, partial [Chitinophagaceae bacterium]|nr:putative baseplate assembly protein [Chitinophagaceae bacterium]
IINEGFLRPATERLSILELARHISYKLKPGVAATTYLVFTMNEAPGAPGKAILPVGTKVQSIPEQDQLPQVFETIEEIEAKVEWGRIKLKNSERKIPIYDGKEIYLKGIVTGLQPGDGLLMIGSERENDSNSERWDFRKVDKVIPDPLANITRVTWKRGLGKQKGNIKILPAKNDFKVFALRQRASLFGYNAPDFRTFSGSVKSEFLSQGLMTRYYENTEFNVFKLERIEDKIDHNWGSGGPSVSGLTNDTFSIIWSGWIQAPATGEITFYTQSDDGVRLYIDNKLIINEWTVHGSKEDSGKVTMQEGRLYSFILEYFENTGDAQIELRWSGPDLAKEIIPAKYFFTMTNGNEWPGFTISEIAGEAEVIHLDAIYSKIIKDSWAVLSKPTYEEVYRVGEAVESSRKNFTLASKTTKLNLIGENMNQLFDNNVRDAVVFGQSEELSIAENPITDSPLGNQIILEKVLPDLPKEKMIIIGGKRRRLKIKTNKPVVLVSPSGEKHTINPGDSLIIAAIPNVVTGQKTTWTLLDSTGFTGTISLSLDSECEFESAKDNDDIISELHEITKIETNNSSTTLTLDTSLATYFDRSSVLVYANIAKATHGETIQETIGSGDSSKAFQKFELKQKPLTYTSASSASGSETTLEIRVNDILWEEATTLYDKSPKDKIYVTSIADDGKVTVQFGDGITGARLPTGTENIKAKYRVGIGSDGLVNEGKLSTLMTPQLGVDKVFNPLVPSGAEDRETKDAARQNAPYTVLTLDRIVSVKDFEDFARAFAGISKARADLLWNGDQQSIVITIAGADKQDVDEKSDLYTNFFAAIKSSGQFYKAIYVKNYKSISFTVDARVKIQSAYLFKNVKDTVVKKLKDTFSFDARDFGQDVTPAEVITAIQQVEGIQYVDLELLDGNKPFNQVNPYRISASMASFDKGNILPAELLTIDTSKINITEILE